MLLADKVISITGAAGGIGRALAQRFLREQPAYIMLADLRLDSVAAVDINAGQRSLDIDLMAPIHVARACLPGMLQSEQSR